MVRLGRNQSLPAPTSHGANMRKASTNVFSFPTINLTRTSSEKSSHAINLSFGSSGGGSSSRSSSKSRSGRSRSGSAAPIPLAPIISAIQRGNFVALSEMDLEFLIKDMMGKDSKVLEALNFSSASVSAADAKVLAKLIKSSEAANIKTLKLEGNSISQQASKLMFEAWKFNKTISTLSLARSGVNDKTIKYLAKVIAKNQTLKVLDLSGNHITAQGAEMLAEAMIVNRSVTRLCLQSNNIKKAGAPHLASILSKNRVIRHMNLSSNGLGAEGSIIVAEAVRFNRTLTSLSMDMNEMGYKGAAAIAAALISNRHLTHLYLPHNNISDRGMAEICTSLQRNRCLLMIDLELNHIGQNQSIVGMKALGEALKVNTSLREINLSFNVFSGEAILELTMGMSMNTTLESVIMTNCCLSTDGAKALAKVLKSATGLQNLGLTSNPDIGVEGYWTLATALLRNRSLKGIQLDYNSDDRQALYDSFQNSLTRNHIWQQAIYSAACRILVLSRVVLLGHPVGKKLSHLQDIQKQRILLQHQQPHHSHKSGWNPFKSFKLGRTNSSNSLTSLLTIGNKSLSGASSHGVDNVSVHGPEIDASAQSYGERSRTVARQSSGASLISSALMGLTGGHGKTHSISSNNADHTVLPPPQPQPHSHHHGSTAMATYHSTASGGTFISTAASTSSSVGTMVAVTADDVQVYEYNPHKILAHLGNMPYEIFENICAFLDPGRTMHINQIRATVQVAGDRSTLVKYYTRERILEKIFNSRYISPVGTRYGLKPGDDRV